MLKPLKLCEHRPAARRRRAEVIYKLIRKFAMTNAMLD